MKLLLPLLALSILASPAPGQAAPPRSEGTGAVIVPIQGPLTEEMVALTIRAIRTAHDRPARALIFEIDTEGGNVELMDRLIDEIERADELHTVAYVTQKAASAGSLIAISCESVYMRPGANMGSALVLMMPQLFGIPLGTPETLRKDNEAYFKKIISHYRAHWRAKAQDHGRPAALAEAMVWTDSAVIEVEVDGTRQYLRESELLELAKVKDESQLRRIRTVCAANDVLNLTAQECYDTGMIDGLATTRADLLEQLSLAHEPVLEVTSSWSENLASFLQSWGIALLIAGLIAIFVEIKVPGFGLPGIVGIVCLGLWMFGKYLAGLAEVTELLLVVLGFGLVAVEIFVLPGTMIAGVAGAVAVIAGLVMAAQQTLLPDPSRPLAEGEWWANANGVVLAMVASAVGMIVLTHFLPRIPILNRAILQPSGGAALTVGGNAAGRAFDELAPGWQPAAGARGTARTTLRPAGKVAIDGRELDAVSEGPLIESGRAIVVAKVEPGRLVVRDAGPTS